MYIRVGMFKKLITEIFIGEVSIYINGAFELSRKAFKNGMEEVEEIQLNGEYYTKDDYDKIKEILERL